MSNDQRCPTGKICYSDRHYAKRAARRIVAKARAVKAQLYAYPCRQCGYWHIGHATKAARSYYREAAERIRRGDLRGMGIVVENGLAGSATDNPAMASLVKKYRAQAAS